MTDVTTSPEAPLSGSRAPLAQLYVHQQATRRNTNSLIPCIKNSPLRMLVLHVIHTLQHCVESAAAKFSSKALLLFKQSQPSAYRNIREHTNNAAGLLEMTVES